MTFDELLKALGPGGVPPLLFFIFALTKRWCVLGWTYDAMVEDRDYWRHLYETGVKVAETAVTVAAQKSGGVE